MVNQTIEIRTLKTRINDIESRLIGMENKIEEIRSAVGAKGIAAIPEPETGEKADIVIDRELVREIVVQQLAAQLPCLEEEESEEDDEAPYRFTSDQKTFYYAYEAKNGFKYFKRGERDSPPEVTEGTTPLTSIPEGFIISLDPKSHTPRIKRRPVDQGVEEE